MAEEQWKGLLARTNSKDYQWQAMPTMEELQGMMKSMPGAGMAIIVTCADPRADPTHYLSLNPGETPIIRNAGGRVTDDVLTSLELMSAVAKINMLVIIHHTECGGIYLTEDAIRRSLSERAPEHASSIANKNWHSYGSIGMDESIRQDVDKMKNWQFLPKNTPIKGYVFDIKSGKLREVASAN